MQSITTAIGGLAWSIGSFFIGPTIFLLLLMRFMPNVGEPLWRAYCRFLAWLIAAPIRLIRLLIREATGYRGR